jgi:hypothetical protein
MSKNLLKFHAQPASVPVSHSRMKTNATFDGETVDDERLAKTEPAIDV